MAEVGRLFGPMQASAQGMRAQRLRMELMARNIANSEVTRTAEGGPYRRQVAQLERTDEGGVRIAGVVEDQTQGVLRYNPGHPDANAEGFVRMPNVDIATEMTEMMIAQRAFQANHSVFRTAKQMLRSALEL
jgi:flagellar basal-body rod protein FlgC